MSAAIIGFGLGFFVALQLGPMSLFLIRSTLRSGWKVGVAIGAGIAAVDGLYAAAGAGGATPLLVIHPVRRVARRQEQFWVDYPTILKEDVRESNSALGAKSKYILVPSAKKNARPVMLSPRPAKVTLRPGVL
jgi:hypothetical protein